MRCARGEKRPAIILAFAMSVVCVSCAPYRVHSDADPQMDFSGYQTFAWISEEPLIRPPGSDAAYISPLNVQRIETAVKDELTRKGYAYVDDAPNTDFVVSFTVGLRDRINVDAYPDYYRGAWQWPYSGHTVRAHSYTEGMLAIDVFDGEMRRPVWHGLARKRISSSDIEEAERLIPEVVAAILSDFPSR